MTGHTRLSVFASLLLFPFVSSSLHAQGITTGSVTGTVVDGSGAVIPGAAVAAISRATGTSHTITADEKGAFNLLQLPSGDYTVTITATGFQMLQVATVVVSAGKESDLGNETLTIGASDHVLVTADTAPIIETGTAQSSLSIPAEAIKELIPNGKLDNVVALQPGVVKAHDAAVLAGANGDNYSINGQRAVSNNFELDGQANNDNSYQGPMILFSNQDAVQEVQVITANYSAEYGRSMGGVVNYITKSGSNRFHGSAYEYYTGSFLSSLNNGVKSPLLGYCAAGVTTGCKVPTVTRFADNRWGGTIGGPLYRGRIWFFGGTNWEHVRKGSSPDTSSNITPTPAGLATLAAALPGNLGVNILKNYGPFSNPAGSPTASNTRLTTIVVPNGPTIANVEQGQITRGLPQQVNDQEHIARIDWQATEKDHFFVRYIYQNSLSLNTGTFNFSQYYNTPRIGHSAGADWVHVFSPTWVNQLRYSFQQVKVDQSNYGGVATCSATNQNPCTSFATITGSVSFGSNVALAGRVQKVTQIQDNATWTHKAHTVKFGGDYTYQNSPSSFLGYYQGGYTFASLGSLLGGAVGDSVILANGNLVIPYQSNDFSLYVQDDWKPIAGVTFNLGLRYEFFSQPLNSLHDMTVKRESNPATAFWNTSLPLSARVYPYTNPNWKNFQPRIGVAINPASLRNLVIRAGYSIQYDPTSYSITNNTAASAPIANQGAVICTAAAPCLPTAFTAAGTRELNLPKIPLGGDPRTRNITNNPVDFKNPYVQTYQLGLQYAFGGVASAYVGYVGNHTIHNFQSINGNPYLQDVATAFPGYFGATPYCTDASAAVSPLSLGRTSCSSLYVRTRANTGFSNYNSLQTQLQTRSFKGLTSFVNYTYSKVLSNSEGVQNITNGAGTYTSMWAQNPLSVSAGEYARSNISMTNVASIGAVYQAPTFGTKRWERLATGGFSLSPTYTFNSGQPWTPYQPTTFSLVSSNVTNSQSYCDNSFNASFISYDACRPVLSNASAPMNTVGIYMSDPNTAYTSRGTGYYNAKVASGGKLTAPGQATDFHWLINNRAYANLVHNPYPGVGRNGQLGQSWNNLDLTLSKVTQIREGVAAQLSLSMFNVMNRNFLGTPDALISDSAFASNAYNTGAYGGTGSGAGVPASRFMILSGTVHF